MTPDHEIIGTVAEVGSEVGGHAVGDLVGVGCFVDACLECEACQDGEEQFCEKGVIQTCSQEDHHGETTFGGCSGLVDLGAPSEDLAVGAFSLLNMLRGLDGGRPGRDPGDARPLR